MIELIEKKISDLSNKLSALNAAKFGIPLPNAKDDVAEYEILIAKHNKSIDKCYAQIEVLKELKKENRDNRKVLLTGKAVEAIGAAKELDESLKPMVKEVPQIDISALRPKLTTKQRFKIADDKAIQIACKKAMMELEKWNAQQKLNRDLEHIKQMQEKYTKN
ncbi:MAG: hypothetical protein KAR12_11625 [Methylococcales bacterium]|nr:hypothetical protein [Methylococcales bacterium]